MSVMSDTSSRPSLPPITSLPTLSDASLASTLDLLFEPSEELHALALPVVRGAAPFASYAELVEALRQALLDVAARLERGIDVRTLRRQLHAVLESHPRLGERRVASPLSAEEQKNLRGGNADGASQEAEDEGLRRLRDLNGEYEKKFPGLRYVVFVNGRGRDVIIEDMKKRIARGDFAAEEREAINAMCDIAADRAAKLQAATLTPSLTS
ncbi:hypothetical protein VTK73DRAFT_8801 [Phialemonium thermophilum]|uniref:Oxo-4-hydroxy-4-carboxy-5-ureidoimidazoline decarboxylase domain-containing protein n=1 Tax=Phialemonium thermophilum TaxID=223376 RepID=A0ABR3W652_9PEZI